MKLPSHRPLTRAEALPDAPLATSPADVAHANHVLADPYLLSRQPVGWLVTGLQVTEQALMAARTHALLSLGKHLLGGQDPRTDIVRLMGFAVAPQLVAAVNAPLKAAWTNGVRDRYDEAFVVSHFNKPDAWVLNKELFDVASQTLLPSERATRTTLYAGNLRWHADNQVNAAIQLQAVALGAAANMFVLGATLGPVMGVAQAAALALALAYGRRAFGGIGDDSREQVRADNAQSGHMRRFWDNVTLGNSNSLTRWQQSYEQMTAHADSLAVATARRSVRRDMTLMALVAGPILLALVVGFAQALQQPAPEVMRQKLQDLVVQGPTLIAATRTIVNLSEATYNGLAKRQQQLANTLSKSQHPKTLDLLQHCRSEDITVTHDGRRQSLRQAFAQLAQDAREGTSGHHVLSGANGTGKSMALLHLKQLLGPHLATIIPAELRDLDYGTAKLSTGEADRQAVEQTLASPTHVLLLDEVTAHLHPGRMQEMRHRISQAAAPKAMGGGGHLVIEISHRTNES